MIAFVFVIVMAAVANTVVSSIFGWTRSETARVRACVLFLLRCSQCTEGARASSLFSEVIGKGCGGPFGRAVCSPADSGHDKFIPNNVMHWYEVAMHWSCIVTANTKFSPNYIQIISKLYPWSLSKTRENQAWEFTNPWRDFCA